MTHDQARKSLAEGVAPELVCATCPWDRLCVEPPTVSRAEIDRQLERSKAEDEARVRRNPEAIPLVTLTMAAILGGRDTSGRLCPVFALRLRGPEGRNLADVLRVQMQGWRET
jgi:hypothetical protein